MPFWIMAALRIMLDLLEDPIRDDRATRFDSDLESCASRLSCPNELTGSEGSGGGLALAAEEAAAQSFVRHSSSVILADPSSFRRHACLPDCRAWASAPRELSGILYRSHHLL